MLYWHVSRVRSPLVTTPSPHTLARQSSALTCRVRFRSPCGTCNTLMWSQSSAHRLAPSSTGLHVSTPPTAVVPVSTRSARTASCSRLSITPTPRFKILSRSLVPHSNTPSLYVHFLPYYLAGRHWQLNVQVIDKNGVRSDPHNCGTSVSGQVSASDLEYLMVFIIFIGVLLLPGLVLLIENVRWHKKMKASRHASKYQNEFKFAEELAPTTADEL